MFQFSKKAQADAEEVQDLTEEQLLEIAGGVAHKTTHKSTHHTSKGHHTTTGHKGHHTTTGHKTHHKTTGKHHK